AGRDVDQALHGAAVALIVDHDRRRDLVPVPGVVGMILVMTLDLAGGDVERDHRRGVEIVARPLIAEPRRGIAGAPEGEVGLGIVGAGHPDRAAAALVMVAACRPGFAAGLAG